MMFRLFTAEAVINPMTGEVILAKGVPFGDVEYKEVAAAGILFVPTVMVLPDQKLYTDEDVKFIIEKSY